MERVKDEFLRSTIRPVRLSTSTFSEPPDESVRLSLGPVRG
jgi:hypothetical protein